jgi:uncharacterized protein (TIGR02444 family)
MQQSLWDFAVTCYARPGVAELCLHLQDRQDADVCLLLAALWLESRGTPATPARLEQLQLVAQPWRQTVIAPLRHLRRDWKEAAARDAELAELRQALAALELRAERRLLERLQQLADTWPAAGGATAVRWLEPLAAARADAAPAISAATLQKLRDVAATSPQS